MNTSPLVQHIGRWLSTSVHYIRSQSDVLPSFVSVLAILVSCGALYVSSSQYGVIARHYRLSVKPHVNVIFYLEGGSERNGISIANPGLGPAIIKALSVEVGGKSYSAEGKRLWQNVFRDLTLVPGCFWQRVVQ
jgi:hypothetical protein